MHFASHVAQQKLAARCQDAPVTMLKEFLNSLPEVSGSENVGTRDEDHLADDGDDNRDDDGDDDPVVDNDDDDCDDRDRDMNRGQRQYTRRKDLPGERRREWQKSPAGSDAGVEKPFPQTRATGTAGEVGSTADDILEVDENVFDWEEEAEDGEDVQGKVLAQNIALIADVVDDEMVNDGNPANVEIAEQSARAAEIVEKPVDGTGLQLGVQLSFEEELKMRVKKMHLVVRDVDEVVVNALETVSSDADDVAKEGKVRENARRSEKTMQEEKRYDESQDEEKESRRSREFSSTPDSSRDRQEFVHSPSPKSKREKDLPSWQGNASPGDKRSKGEAEGERKKNGKEEEGAGKIKKRGESEEGDKWEEAKEGRMGKVGREWKWMEQEQEQEQEHERQKMRKKQDEDEDEDEDEDDAKRVRNLGAILSHQISFLGLVDVNSWKTSDKSSRRRQ
eukprot:754705-Hanusia_phi.AAC.1